MTKENIYEGGSESVRETTNNPTGKEIGPALGENAAEAQRMAYAGRSSVALRESKIFDTERLNESPLFERRLFQ